MTTKKLTLARPSFEELLPTKKSQQAFDDRTAAFEAGRLVSHMRRSANLTQVQLAARLGVTQSRISTVESGDGIDGPTFGLLKRIVLACDFKWDPHFAFAERTPLQRETEPEVRATVGSKAAAAKSKTTGSNVVFEPMIPSKALAAVIGPGPLPPTQVVAKVWAYIKMHKLQNKANEHEIFADAKLKAVFGKDKVTLFEMKKHLGASMIGRSPMIRPRAQAQKRSAASE